MNLFKAIVLDVWKDRQSEKKALIAELERNIDKIEAKRSIFTDALVDELIIKAVHDKKIGKLTDESESAKSELELLRDDSFDPTGVLDFAECFMVQPHETWAGLAIRKKKVFQNAVFPQGITFDGEKLETAKISLIYSMLKNFSAQTSKLTSPMEFAPPHQGAMLKLKKSSW